MNAIEWLLIAGVVGVLVGPFFALKAVSAIRARRRGKSGDGSK